MELTKLNKDTIKGLPNEFGIYKIFLFDSAGPIKIQRYGGVDDSGLVYIGMSNKQGLQTRLKNFEITFRMEKTRNHTAAIKLKTRKILSNLRNSTCYVSFEIHEEPKSIEKAFIASYVDRFGEKPLLNG